MKNKILLLFLMISLMLVPTTSAFAGSSESVTVPGGLTYWIHDVVRDRTVSINVRDFPSNDDDAKFRVELGRIGSNFEPIVVGFLEGKRSEFIETFKIPEKLKTELNIAIRIVNTKTERSAHDIFANETGWNSTKPLTFTSVHQSSGQSDGGSVGIFQGPDFWVEGINTTVQPNQITIRFKYHDENDSKYRIQIGQNNANFEGINIGEFDDDYPYHFKLTLDLPYAITSLPEDTDLMIRVVNTHNGHSGSASFTFAKDFKTTSPFGYYTTTFIDLAIANKTPRYGTSSFSILNVVENSEVTMQLYNFPPDMNFTVTMGHIGTKGIGGFVIGTQPTGDGGSFIVTYPIPTQLKGSETIAVRFQSTTTERYSYNFFNNIEGYNEITGAGAGVNSGDYILAVGTYPTFVVNSVDKDKTITVSGFNFTKNDTYVVRMAPFGTNGVGGEAIRTYVTDGSGTFTTTLNIPDSLSGQFMIAVRFESQNTAYYAYDFFYNE